MYRLRAEQNGFRLLDALDPPNRIGETDPPGLVFRLNLHQVERLGTAGRFQCDLRPSGLFFFVPLIDQPFHYPAHLVEFFLVIHHLFAGVTRNRVLLFEKYGLLGTHLFA